MPQQVEKQFIRVYDRSLSDTLRMLREIDNQVGSVRMLRGSVRYAAAPMLSEMKRRVPYENPPTDDYHLRDYMRLQLEPKRRRQRSEVQFRLGPARVTSDGVDGYRIKGGLSKNPKAPNYAHLVEKQTHWMQSSFDQEAPTFVRLFARNVQKRAINALKRKIKRESAVKK